MEDRMDTLYQEVIFKTRYSRWLWTKGRRETWPETVTRYTDYIFKQAGIDSLNLKNAVFQAIYKMEVMPSMRALMTAGPALDISNVAGFNCAYLPIDSLTSFDEMLYILMCGTGVGFSVERRNTDKLPVIPSEFKPCDPIVVEDSKMGWAEAIHLMIEALYDGLECPLDVSGVREAGAPLKTFGGRASGPQPLLEMASFITRTITHAAGRKLRPIECHDIACAIASCVVVGGVRRSALISLSDLDDVEMREAKSGEWWIEHPQRALANNSAVYEGDIDRGEFDVEWAALVASGSGERGIFNRSAARRAAASMGRDPFADYGTNPCGEIILLPYEFCNLTEVVARSDDTRESLERKIELATILGTFQSTLTRFDYLRSIWKDNCDKERLLGVSLTGIYDCPVLHDRVLLAQLRQLSHDVNYGWAVRLGIKPSASITCVKPSGTVSQLVNAASGIHPRHAKHYLRRIRNDSKDPVTKFLMDNGIPVEVDFYNPQAVVFTFPQRAPEGAITREEVTPLSHLSTWLDFKQAFCDHNPSVTINVPDGQWDAVGDWVYDNFDQVCGLSFLPHSDHTYQQAPYEAIDEYTYKSVNETIPKSVLWSDLYYYENGGADIVAGRELSCSAAGGCEV